MSGEFIQKRSGIQFQLLGMQSYESAFEKQIDLRARRQRNIISDTVLLLEHPRVITRGRRSCDEDFLQPPQKIEEQGITIISANRGGKLTYHGPGQLVIYFIFSLQDRALSIPQFVCRIEDSAIQMLKKFGLSPIRKENSPGLWIENRKIVSIGLSVDRGVTMHGMAINVCTDLKDFELIVPCGMAQGQMTSVEKELGFTVEISKFEKEAIESIAQSFEGKG